jgi:hypothetical protein
VQTGGQRPGELPHPGRQPVTTPDPGLVVPDQPPRDRADLTGQQRPHPRQQVRRPARGNHHRGDELGERGHHHQHRQQHRRPVIDRDPRLGEPQIALDLLTRVIHDPIGRIGRRIVGADPRHVLPEPGRRPRPAHPLGQHRRRHRRRHLQQPTDPLLERRETGRHRRPRVLRRPRRSHSLRHRVPADPQIPGDLRLRHPLTQMQPADQRPVFQGDHFPIVGRCSQFERHICSVFERHRHVHQLLLTELVEDRYLDHSWLRLQPAPPQCRTDPPFQSAGGLDLYPPPSPPPPGQRPYVVRSGK